MPDFNPQGVLIQTAELMCAAARTAPKTKGIDLLSVFYLMPDEFGPVLDEMRAMSLKYDHLRPQRPYERDVICLQQAACLVVIASRRRLMDIAGCDACGFTGEPNGCKAAAKAGAACVYNAKDLGIALSSAALVAHWRLIDNRIIDTAGRAIVNRELYPQYTNGKVFDAAAIALSVSPKNPFFDRLEQELDGHSQLAPKDAEEQGTNQ